MLNEKELTEAKSADGIAAEDALFSAKLRVRKMLGKLDDDPQWSLAPMLSQLEAKFKQLPAAHSEQGWVSVRETKPPVRLCVLVWVERSKCKFTAYYDGGEFYEFNPSGGMTDIDEEVTHWMPLDFIAPPVKPESAQEVK